MSQNADHSWPCGTGSWTDGPRVNRLSKNTDQGAPCGTGSRTKRPVGGGVCPQTRTTAAAGACGTAVGTNGGVWSPSFVRNRGPQLAGEHVVRACGQTRSREIPFVLKHVPLCPMWYGFQDRWPVGETFVQKHGPRCPMWYGFLDRWLAGDLFVHRPVPLCPKRDARTVPVSQSQIGAPPQANPIPDGGFPAGCCGYCFGSTNELQSDGEVRRSCGIVRLPQPWGLRQCKGAHHDGDRDCEQQDRRAHFHARSSGRRSHA